MTSEELRSEWHMIQDKTRELTRLLDCEAWSDLVNVIEQRKQLIEKFIARYDHSSDPLNLAEHIAKLQTTDRLMQNKISTRRSKLMLDFEKQQHRFLAEIAYKNSLTTR